MGSICKKQDRWNWVSRLQQRTQKLQKLRSFSRAFELVKKGEGGGGYIATRSRVRISPGLPLDSPGSTKPHIQPFLRARFILDY
jgi:hypothetical protein